MCGKIIKLTLSISNAAKKTEAVNQRPNASGGYLSLERRSPITGKSLLTVCMILTHPVRSTIDPKATAATTQEGNSPAEGRHDSDKSCLG